MIMQKMMSIWLSLKLIQFNQRVWHRVGAIQPTFLQETFAPSHPHRCRHRLDYLRLQHPFPTSYYWLYFQYCFQDGFLQHFAILLVILLVILNFLNWNFCFKFELTWYMQEYWTNQERNIGRIRRRYLIRLLWQEWSEM